MRSLVLKVLTLSVVLCVPSAALAQGSGDVDAINQLIDRYGALEDAMDMTTQAGLMSEDRVWIAQGFGRRTNQAQNIAIQQATFDAMKEQAPGIKTFTEDRDRLIKFYGNGRVAIASFFRYQTAVLPADAPEAVVAAMSVIPASAATLVLEKQNGEWKIVHTHFSALGPQAGGN